MLLLLLSILLLLGVLAGVVSVSTLAVTLAVGALLNTLVVRLLDLLLLLHLLLLGATGATVAVLVVVVVRLQDLLPQFLLSLVDVRVEFVAVLADRELLIVVNRDIDLARANGLVIHIVELGDIGMAKGLLCCQSLVRVELKQIS